MELRSFDLRVIRISVILTLLVFYVSPALGQNWMPGYNYRKKITINKSKVSGAVNLIDFPVLVALKSIDFQYFPGRCTGNKLSGPKGYDISFASVHAATVPLDFQLDSYRAETGELICWVKIPVLSASGNSALSNEFYLYYGSNAIHHPYRASALKTWSADYYRLWHMVPEDLQRLKGSADIGTDDLIAGHLGTGLQFNGNSSYLNAALDTSTTFTVSTWIKFMETGVPQTIVANDSINLGGGYQLKINAAGNVQFDTYNFSIINTTIGNSTVIPNAWNHVVVSFKGNSKNIYVNGKSAGNINGGSIRITRGGMMVIGRNKQGNQYFKGQIDELRIEHIERPPDWIKTNFTNQSEPVAFYTVATEELNPQHIVTGAVFTGDVNELWTVPGNWNIEAVPEDGINVIVKAGKTMNIPGATIASISTLVLEKDARLFIPGQIRVSCATINSGSINVQRIIDGPFPDPATARGWRLLSSPVYQPTLGNEKYGLNGIQSSMFVTGAGGAANGFDPSLNNGATIYTHEESLSGSLSQKYKAIPNVNMTIQVGKGFYVFSRGNRNVNGAYASQISNPPFSNPESYLLTYTGELFIGNLTLPVSNSNYGQEGDGFNLLGNPYASDVTWGSLTKVNVGPFIWYFDPLNNAYQVSDDPNLIIRSGMGFFVRVIAGASNGSITFTPSVKQFESSTLSRKIQSTGVSPLPAIKFKVKVSRSVFSDEYVLVFKEDGQNEVTDADALKVGTGYVSIAGLTTQKIRLAVEDRSLEPGKTELKLSVSGWSPGTYLLALEGADHFTKGSKIILYDTYLGMKKVIAATMETYPFTIDAQPESQGDQRFYLVFEIPGAPEVKELLKDGPTVYPIPFTDLLHLKTNSFTAAVCEVFIRDLAGKIFWRKIVGELGKDQSIDLPCTGLPAGIYVLELLDLNKRRIYKSIKIIKQ